jgi:hypothetical protein
MVLLLFAVACSVAWVWLVVHLAGERGRNKVAWGFAGFFGGLIALVILLVLPNLAEREERAERLAAERADSERRHAETLAAITAGRVAPQPARDTRGNT